ncbi:L,D-transpeptidase [Acuticoccus sp.]|uniref:L,D-transpeptidase n=1 Tax=Acuticoccus sp. TaxID=1904378 RepID=UPI003B51E62F
MSDVWTWMGRPGRSLALAVALAASSVGAANADTERARWINSLREHSAASDARPATTSAIDPRDVAASTPPAPRYRTMSNGLVVPASPSSVAVDRPGLRRTALATPQSTQPIVPRMDPRFLPADVGFAGHAPGTIVIDTVAKYLYHVQPGGTARRYGVGVGRPGFQWAGTHRVSMKREWPGWTPPAAMRRRQPELPAYMPGGPDNPLGARSLYLGSTLYRIHGSNAPWTIGTEVSSGCIRMRNEDVIELYARVAIGTRVVVLR